MNWCRPCSRWLAIWPLIASTAAAAGNMGPTSRATISISIVIPPHLEIAPATSLDADARSDAARKLCLETNGLHHYHLTLVAGSSAIDDGQIISPAAGATCIAANAALPQQSTRDVANAGTSLKMMLFIVPD